MPNTLISFRLLINFGGDAHKVAKYIQVYIYSYL